MLWYQKDRDLKCSAVPVLFQPSRNFDIESSLVFGEDVMVSAVGKSKFVAPVSNPGETDVVTKARAHVGVVSAVSSVTPCPIYEKPESKHDVEVRSQEVKGGNRMKSKPNFKVGEGAVAGKDTAAGKDAVVDKGTVDGENVCRLKSGKVCSASNK